MGAGGLGEALRVIPLPPQTPWCNENPQNLTVREKEYLNPKFRQLGETSKCHESNTCFGWYFGASGICSTSTEQWTHDSLIWARQLARLKSQAIGDQELSPVWGGGRIVVCRVHVSRCRAVCGLQDVLKSFGQISSSFRSCGAPWPQRTQKRRPGAGR